MCWDWISGLKPWQRPHQVLGHHLNLKKFKNMFLENYCIFRRFRPKFTPSSPLCISGENNGFWAIFSLAWRGAWGVSTTESVWPKFANRSFERHMFQPYCFGPLKFRSSPHTHSQTDYQYDSSNKYRPLQIWPSLSCGTSLPILLDSNFCFFPSFSPIFAILI